MPEEDPKLHPAPCARGELSLLEILSRKRLFPCVLCIFTVSPFPSFPERAYLSAAVTCDGADGDGCGGSKQRSRGSTRGFRGPAWDDRSIIDRGKERIGTSTSDHSSGWGGSFGGGRGNRGRGGKGDFLLLHRGCVGIRSEPNIASFKVNCLMTDSR